MKKLLYADGHLHTNPVNGLGAERVLSKFRDRGGWFAVLVSLGPHHYGLEEDYDGFIKSIEILINECRVARDLGLRTICMAGIHPADIDKLISKDKHRGRGVLEFIMKIIDYIAKLIKEGTLDGFGEFGRPHYKSSPEAFTLNNIVMRYILNLARDLHAYVHLHLETAGFITVRDIYEVIEIIGIDKTKVFLHHLDVFTGIEAENMGLPFTLPGKYALLREAVRRIKPVYIVESDFIDDPKRPGVSSYPWEIIDNQEKLISEGLVDEDYITRINIDNVIRLYKVPSP